MDFTDQPKPTQTHITDQPPDGQLHPAAPEPLTVGAKTDFVGYVLLVLGVAVATALMAVIGGWPLVSLAVLVTALGVIHYWTWGRSLTRKVADEHATEFRRQLGVDPNQLSEVERPRHF